jgi:hypothetical protein
LQVHGENSRRNGLDPAGGAACNHAMRRLIKLLVATAALAIVAAFLLVLIVDRAAKAAIERGGTYALGVTTTLDEASIGLVDGRFALESLEVANPKGFDAPQFVRLGHGELELSLGTLWSDRVEASTLALRDVALSIERKDGKANYDEILKSLERFGSSGGGEAPPPKEPQAPGKSFVIHDVVLENVTAQIQLVPIGGELTKTTVTIPRVHLKNVGNDGLSLSELVASILDGALRAVIEAGGKDLPKELLKDLSKDRKSVV